MSETILKVVDLKRNFSPLLYRMAKFLKFDKAAGKLEHKVQTAVDGISFEIASGEICGLLGPNGAGKSTTIKAIAGLIYKDGGDIFISGVNTKGNLVKLLNNVGGVIENPDMYRNLSGRDNLKYYAALRGGISKERIDEVLKIVGLDQRADDRFSKYSMGMKQRLGIAQAIMHKPRLLLLDEPANGLDPQGIIDLRKLLKKLAHEEGMAIMLSSHQLSEMQLMCDRVIIMDKGRIVAEKKIDELNDAEGMVSVEFITDQTEEARAFIEEKYGVKAEGGNGKINLSLSKELVPQMTKDLLLNGIMVSGVQIKEKTLEDLFVEMTGGKTIG